MAGRARRVGTVHRSSRSNIRSTRLLPDALGGANSSRILLFVCFSALPATHQVSQCCRRYNKMSFTAANYASPFHCNRGRITVSKASNYREPACQDLRFDVRNRQPCAIIWHRAQMSTEGPSSPLMAFVAECFCRGLHAPRSLRNKLCAEVHGQAGIIPSCDSMTCVLSFFPSPSGAAVFLSSSRGVPFRLRSGRVEAGHSLPCWLEVDCRSHSHHSSCLWSVWTPEHQCLSLGSRQFRPK